MINRILSMRLIGAILIDLLHKLGVLRTGLAISTLLVIVAAPFASGEVYMHDWRIFPSVVAPTVMMMLVFTYPLDITMSFVFMSDVEVEEKRRFKTIIWCDVILLLCMVLAWIPFMLRVLDFSPFD